MSEIDEFIEYFRNMKMSRSYKPVLVIATIQNGGAITLEKAAQQFTRYYQDRADKGMPTEIGYSILDIDDRLNQKRSKKRPPMKCEEELWAYIQTI